MRILQESVNNVRKHADASNLWVSLSVDPPRASLTVADDGVGLGTARPDSYGQSIMNERARRIGATLQIAERDEGGTVVSVSLA